MPQLLIEFFSEEIPARMQKRAEEDFARALKEKLAGHGLNAAALATFSTPRRIGVVIDDLPGKAADVKEEKKGPRVGAPEQAVAGFLKSAGLARIEDAQIVEDKKGAFYVARIERAGRATGAILQEIIPEIVRGFPWPKSMRSGKSELQWVRPLQNILCLFDGAAVKIEVGGVPSEAVTRGHRFHAPAPISVTSVAQYKQALAGAHVVLEREERKRLILDGAKAACAAKGLELVEDSGLLEEVAGLVEWPVVLLGDMDPAFLDLPGEVIRLSMRTHQKFFAVRGRDGKLAPHFVTVANVAAKDAGAAIAAGNARVLSARLNDARFFWDSDRKLALDDPSRVEKLKKIVFHQKLGSVWDKVERVRALAVELCAVTGADVGLVARAALLCKADLVTETVGEFPELQGQIGRQLYLAQPILALDGRGGRAEGADGVGGGATTFTPAQPPTQSSRTRADSSPIKGEHESVAIAIEDHYRPLGPNDRVPSDLVAVTLALADKLDTLVGFWAIDEKPTGSSDPYALRRAALGVVRLILQSDVRIGLTSILGRTHTMQAFRWAPAVWPYQLAKTLRFPHIEGVDEYAPLARPLDLIALSDWLHDRPNAESENGAKNLFGYRWSINGDHSNKPKIDPLEDAEFFLICRSDVENGLTAFLADRLKIQLRDQGKRHDLVDAVFALGDDDLVRIVARVEALDAFLKSQDGANLLAGYKRAANILAAEEKKGRWLTAEDVAGGLDAALLVEPAERALYEALEAALPAARAGVEKEDLAAAMRALAGLRAPVDAFFEGVLVNAEEPTLRRNRLLLLSRLTEALSAVADFSKIEG